MTTIDEKTKRLLEEHEKSQEKEINYLLEKRINYLGSDKVIYEFNNSKMNPSLKVFYDGRISDYNKRENNRIDKTIETFMKNNKRGGIEVQLVGFNTDEKNKGLKKILSWIKKTQREIEKEKKNDK